jgi:ADP-ribose pyrophosphatase YjhB (NUDIX family)
VKTLILPKAAPMPELLSREAFDRLKGDGIMVTLDLACRFAPNDSTLERAGKFLMLRRIISPYDGELALPGLRMHKGDETIAGVLSRIALQELGLDVEGCPAQFITQETVIFQGDRQDMSTAYMVELPIDCLIAPNKGHFDGETWFIGSPDEIPNDTGALYRNILLSAFDDMPDLN